MYFCFVLYNMLLFDKLLWSYETFLLYETALVDTCVTKESEVSK
jgi:hypothetical protein